MTWNERKFVNDVLAQNVKDVLAQNVNDVMLDRPAPPRIIKLYQIFPFKMNYGTIRMELWIGCAPYRLTVFVESDHRLHSIC